MGSRYLSRVVDAELEDRLASAGAVLIEGPKACGKTETAKQMAASQVRLDVDAGARSLVGASPETLFSLEAPILFDEWQVTPDLWNLIRREVDDRWPAHGQFILTGSAMPNDDVQRHSGAGRVSVLRMRPLSLFESGISTGTVSIARLFDGEAPAALEPGVSVPEILEALVIGGWPGLVGATQASARQWLRDYLTNLIEIDVQHLGRRRDPSSIRRLLSALGRAVGTDTTVQALARDVGGADGAADRDAVAGYLKALERLMVIEDVPSWAPHMRSATPLRKSATRFFTDPSLAIAAMGVGVDQLLKDLHATGFHFEGMVARDLRCYLGPLHGSLSHWRDNNGHEVDFILTLDDGRWGACEVKMNPEEIDRAAESLLRFAQKVDLSRVGPPSFLGVITTRSAAYQRPDSVLVIPLAALAP